MSRNLYNINEEKFNEDNENQDTEHNLEQDEYDSVGEDVEVSDMEDEEYDDLDDREYFGIGGSGNFYDTGFVAGLNSVNILIKDNYRTVHPDTYDILDQLGASRRKYDTVLSQNTIIKNGPFALSYYQIFETILKNTIYDDALRIGLALKNKSFLRHLVYEVIDLIPTYVNRKSQGYLRKNMCISRQFINSSIKKVLEDKITKSRYTERVQFRNGLASMIELAILAQLLNYDLIDSSELSEKSLVHMSSMFPDVVDDRTIKGLILATEVNRVILDIVGSTSKLSDFEDSDNKSVDNEHVVSNVVAELDRIADSLIFFEATSNDLNDLLLLCRVYRDRYMLSQLTDLQQLVSECTLVYENNSQLLNSILLNYDFNKILDGFTLLNLVDFSNRCRGLLSISMQRYSRIVDLIRQSFDREDSIIKFMDKAEFNSKFIIKKKTDSYGNTYLMNCTRKISGTEKINMLEVLGFKENLSRDLIKFRVPIKENIKILVNKKHKHREDSNFIVNAATEAYVKAFERAYEFASEHMINKAADYSIHQHCLLLPGDLEKLAAINCDEYVVPYSVYCSDIVDELVNIYGMTDVYTDSKSEYRIDRLFIVNKYNRYNKDVTKCRDGVKRLITTINLRVLEAIDHKDQGVAGIKIDSGSVPEGIVNISSEYSERELCRDVVVYPLHKGLRIRLIEAKKIGSIQDLYMNLDLDNLFRPASDINKLITVKDRYSEILSSYCKCLSIFTLSILNSTSGLIIQDEMLEQSIVSKESINIVNTINSGFNSTEPNHVEWICHQSEVSSFFNIASIRMALEQYSRGYMMPFGSEDIIVTIKSGFSRGPNRGYVYNSSELVDLVKSINLNKKHSIDYSNVSYYFNSYAIYLYHSNEFLRSIVDQSLNCSFDHMDFSRDDVQSVVDMFERVNNRYIPDYIKIKATCNILLFLLAVADQGGDIDSYMTRRKKVRAIIDAFMFSHPLGMIYKRNAFDDFEHITDRTFISRMQIVEELNFESDESLYNISSSESKGDLFTNFNREEFVKSKIYERMNGNKELRSRLRDSKKNKKDLNNEEEKD